ncbi:hypothetical protein [Xanthomonas citri]|uniref:hypothetical protein n=2 Tax=Xanthomonas citri TaxID=346 RepID=UPI0012378EE6|nr:hypothetical protein [Xanthomonas citri]
MSGRGKLFSPQVRDDIAAAMDAAIAAVPDGTKRKRTRRARLASDADIAHAREVGGRLDELPERPSETIKPVTEKQLISELKSKLQAAQRKGYTLDELISIMKGDSSYIDVVKPDLAGKVHQHVNGNYYAVLLDALQKAARDLGCYFAVNETDGPAVWIEWSPVVRKALAWAVHYRKQSYLYPLGGSERWEKNTKMAMEDGFAQETVVLMLEALAREGIRLQAAPHATSLLAAERCRQRENGIEEMTPRTAEWSSKLSTSDSERKPE